MHMSSTKKIVLNVRDLKNIDESAFLEFDSIKIITCKVTRDQENESTVCISILWDKDRTNIFFFNHINNVHSIYRMNFQIRVEFRVENEFFSFSSFFRFFVESNSEKELDKETVCILRKKDGNGVIDDLFRAIQLEITRKSSKEDFEIIFVQTREGKKISRSNAFSYFFFINNNQLVKEVIVILRRKEKKYFSSLRQYDEVILKCISFELSELFEESFQSLPENPPEHDLRLSILKVSALFFLHPQKFLKSAKTLMRKIERRILRERCPKETFIIKSKVKLDLSRISKNLNKGASINISVFKILEYLGKSANSSRNFRLSKKLFKKFYEKMLISSLLRNISVQLFELCVRGGLAAVSITTLTRYFISCISAVKSSPKFRGYINTADQSMGKRRSRSILKKKLEGFLKEKSSRIEFFPIEHENIVFLFEVAYLFYLENQFEKGFKIIYTICFCSIIKCDNTHSRIQSFKSYKLFKDHVNPFLLSPQDRIRVFDILFKYFLIYPNKVEKILDKKEDKTTTTTTTTTYNKSPFLKSKEECYKYFAFLCFRRGEFRLSERYLELIKKKDSESFYLQAELIFRRGQYYGKEIFEVFSSFSKKEGIKIFNIIDIEKIKEIIDPNNNDNEKKKKKEEEEEGEGEQQEEQEEEEDFVMYRIPSFFTDGIMIILGEKKKERHKKHDFDEEVCLSFYLAEKCIQFDPSSNERIMKDPIMKKLSPSFVNKRKKLEKEDCLFLDLMYRLSVISFLKQDFLQLKKWILLLSDLEFMIESYQYTINSSMHHFYQVVSNLFYFEEEKKLRIISSSMKKKNKKKIFVVGDGQILPFCGQVVNIRGEYYDLFPIFCEDIRIIHLTEVSVNIQKKSLLSQISKHYREEKKKKNMKIIFMIGELDIRDRVMNMTPVDGDLLHKSFSEEHQIIILSKIYLRFVESMRKKFQFEKVAVCPIFPFLNPIEEERIYLEKSKYDDGNEGCGNRIKIFNVNLERLCKTKYSGKIEVLSSLNEYIIGIEEEEEVKEEFDLGYASFIKPVKKFMNEFENSLKRANF